MSMYVYAGSSEVKITISIISVWWSSFVLCPVPGYRETGTDETHTGWLSSCTIHKMFLKRIGHIQRKLTLNHRERLARHKNVSMETTPSAEERPCWFNLAAKQNTKKRVLRIPCPTPICIDYFIPWIRWLHEEPVDLLQAYRSPSPLFIREFFSLLECTQEVGLCPAAIHLEPAPWGTLASAKRPSWPAGWNP